MHTSASRASLLPVLRPRTQEGLCDFYKELRSTDDLFWDRRLDAWIATSHAVVSSTAADPRFSSVRYPDIAAVSEELQPLARVLSRQMLYSDAPDHPRLRALLSRAFTPGQWRRSATGSPWPSSRSSPARRRPDGWTSSRTSPGPCP
ncbi:MULTISPECIES: cytochrome P450 [unclassified Streptomyces]|uniref:cytochrome P450 n=1 Tax=unclassified Streptomyces TaxID=2593676 RepID=UPI001F105B8A|nr:MULTISPECIES: cytochrome P450 [unclassified Streptomyces]